MRNLLTLLGMCAASTYALGQTELPAKLHRAATAAAPAPRVAAHVDPNSRIGGDLQALYQQSRAAARGTGAQLRATFPDLLLDGTGQLVLVRITAKDVAALRPLLVARGFVVVSDKSKLHFIEGQLPIEQLAPGAAGIAALAAQGLLGVLPVIAPETNTGRVLNQADFLLEAARVRGTKPNGYTGAGVRVGVMSDSYNALGTAAAGVASGDLPNNVQVIQDLAPGTGTDEGRAMIELIHDIAPGAGKAFASVYRGEADFADQILRLADPTVGNCKILVDDISYFNEPMFQDGIIAQAIDEVGSRLGVAYYSSAGNAADASSEYASPVFVAAGTGGAAELNFNPGGTADTRQRFRVPNKGVLQLAIQWSDPFYTAAGVKTDLDAYLIVNRAVPVKGDTVAFSTANNIANQTPLEYVSFTNARTDTVTSFNLVIRRRAGTADPTRVKYVSYGNNITPLEYFTHSGTVVGHHAALNSMAVAAAPSYNRLAPEGFTSKGQPTYLFNADGSPLAVPVVRSKPDFTSIDGVSTTFFAGGAVPDPKDGFLFFGTSAAAPNAAAVAALLLQAQPTFTPAQLNARLKSTALDISTPGYDALTGAGLINAYFAIYGAPVAAAAPFVDTFDGTALGKAWSVTSRGPARVTVRQDFTPASMPGHLVMDSFFPYYNFGDYVNGARVSQADLLLNLSGASAGGVVLSFKQKKFVGETDEQMPTQFTGSSNTDGVAISTDGGTTWYRLVDLTGTAATTSYQAQTVNLTQFAQANNLTLGADVRIRFQRNGREQVDSGTTPPRVGGRAFDDVAVTSPTPAPVALFNSTATTAAVCPGTAVKFTDASLFAPTSYAWSFPGGTPATSTVASPTVVYNTGGTFDVTLTVTNAYGTSTRTVTGLVVISTVVPLANFTFQQATVCPGGKVKFTNTSTQCPTSYAWSFPGGIPTTSTAPNPVVTYPTAGTFTASLVASNGNGSSIAKTQTITVQSTALPIPFAETFSNGIPSAWGVLNPDNGLTWTSAPDILRKDGTRGTVVLMPFANYAAVGQRDTLQSPPLDLSSQSRAFLHFDLAYGPYSGASDSLGVDVYTACTATRLGRVYLKSAATGLATTLPRDNTPYAPTSPLQWRTENVDLSAFLGKQVYLRFVAFNQYGNNLYLNNVRVDNAAALAAKNALADSPALQAYPNPVAGGNSLTLALPTGQGNAAVRLVDALGRTTWQGTVALSAAATTRRTLTAPLASGLYTVLCQTADGQLYSRRVVVE